MNRAAGMKSLAVHFPDEVRDNDYFREKYPDIIADAEQRTLAKLWPKSGDNAAELSIFQQEMAPYLDDPFRGTVHRRAVGRGENALDLEKAAAQKALAAASMNIDDIDLMIVGSFLGDEVGVGNAPRLATALNLKGAAWNLETACSTSVVGFQTAAGLVSAGQFRNVLVVVSCTYSRFADERDSMSWFLGDGAAAFIVGEVGEGCGFLGGKTLHTGDTCDTFYYNLEINESGGLPKIGMHCTAKTARVLGSTAEPYLRACCEGAAQRAGVPLDAIDTFIFNTPTAWYAKFGARVLGIDPERTLSTYRHYGNIGPVLMPANLHYALHQKRLREGSLVMLYSVGSVSSASAAVMRWSPAGIGELPRGVTLG